MKNIIKNKFILFFLHFIRKFLKKPSFNKKKQKILIVSTTALGDTLWATPSIRSIKKKYPNCFLACLVSPCGEEVLRNNPYIDKIITLKKPLLFYFFSILKKLKKYHFQKILIFHFSERAVLPLCYLLNCPIIGTLKINKGLDDLLDEKIEQKDIHEIQRRFEIIKKINITSFDPKMDFFIKKNPSFTRNLHFKKPTVLFHPGSKDPYKRWPKEYFKKLGLLLEKKADIIITGTKKELFILDYLKKEIPFSYVFYDKPLNDLAILIKKADIIITNDTGPLHLAFALSKKTIGIFMPSNIKHVGPYHVKSAIIIKKEKPCEKCLKRKCKHPFCFLKIKPEEVFSVCEKIL